MPLADDPRLYIRNRALRLLRLIELDAPLNIIHSEIQLLRQALEAFEKAEPEQKLDS